MATSLSKMLGVLDLFREGNAVWSADAICDELGFSRSSGYRYVRELSAAGLLTRLTGGTYALGPRIIELEFVMRTSDPVAKVGGPLLKRLAAVTGCDALLSNIHGLHIINIAHERGMENLNISYLRGRLHPLFRGATAKAILPFLGRHQLVKIYERHQADIARAQLGDTWLAFWQHLQAIKRQGFSVSVGELDPDLSGLAVPVFSKDGVLGSLAFAYSSARAKLLNQEGLVEQLRDASTWLSAELERMSAVAAPRGAAAAA
jgi:DNA-binding IclR family transcriptional regulator